MKEEKLLGQIQNALTDISLTEELQAALIKDIEAIENVEFKQNNGHIDDMQKKVKKINADLDRLLELLINKSITDEEYNRKHTDLIRQKDDLNAVVEEMDIDYDELRLSVNTVLELSRNAAKLFKSSKTEEKQKILNLILSNLKLKNKMIDFSYRKPFNLMKDLKDCTLWGTMLYDFYNYFSSNDVYDILNI